MLQTHEAKVFFSIIFIAAISFTVSHLVTWYIVRKRNKAFVTGIDVHKKDKPVVPEMGGYGIIAGTMAGLLSALFINLFIFSFFSQGANLIIAAALVVAIAGLIGSFDDLFDIPQWFKAILPLFIATPLIVLSAAGDTSINIPYIGQVDFGIFYLIVLVPLAITVCSNLTNMLAGFNGLETGMSAIVFAGLAVLGLFGSNPYLYIPTISALFASIAFLLFNMYPARVFPGDTGTFTLGAVIATSVIIGNLESAGVFMLILFYIDFFLKLLAKFPKSFCEIREDGKLYPPNGRIRGLADLILVKTGGLKEKDLVLLLWGLQAIITFTVVIIFFVLWQ